MRVFGLAGRAGSGKTSLMVRLVSELAGRGVTVSAVTDVRDPDEIDRPGKDSFRHCAAGAEEVVVASALRWALIRGRRDDAEPVFDDIVSRMTPVDLVLVDGGGRGDHPRLEVHRAAHP
ncbi:MAG: molybdopterin-guanine dinucleotide biosynthesis protein B, partial [Proteobacteria bacterium]|nr:molybdopterin-guanine dinucleotide biosynthesis protein B [Pseudomonadota bacterium]